VILFAAKHLNVPTNDYQDKILVFWDKPQDDGNVNFQNTGNILQDLNLQQNIYCP
jgi:hypothetical protein